MDSYFYIPPSRFALLGEEKCSLIANYFHLHYYGVRQEAGGNVLWPLVKGYSANLPYRIPGARKHIYNIARHLDAAIPSHPYFHIKMLPRDVQERRAVFNQPDFFAIAAVFSVFGGRHPVVNFNWRMDFGYGVFWLKPRPDPEDPELVNILI